MKRLRIAILSITVLFFTAFTKTSYDNYTITHGQAGPFTINSAFPGEGKHFGYDIVKKQTIRYAEDGADTLTIFHAQKEEITHIIIHPKFDNNALIEELEVVSPLYETKAGIGVGSSINDFYSYYNDAEALFTFVSDSYWLETRAVHGAQFQFQAKSHKGAPDTFEDLTILEKNKIDTKGRIIKIRLF
ncbi:hypothetical protein ABW636_10445 [Aquimarina sp. 2201CG1-2-11]|uniref:hypothetical protein n=1 Tax=Aquimarina discodermiae TaxID=3231043 RepID=UPI0034621FBF